jgi:sugar phosphate isomerase/epimerase
MLELIQAIGAGNVGLLLDCYHVYTSHGSLDEVRRLTNSDIVVVHVNDAPAGAPVDEQLDLVRTLPGETGVIDIAGFLQALQAIGYDGPVTPEPFSQRLHSLSPASAAGEAGEAMRRIWELAGLSK